MIKLKQPGQEELIQKLENDIHQLEIQVEGLDARNFSYSNKIHRLEEDNEELAELYQDLGRTFHIESEKLDTAISALEITEKALRQLSGFLVQGNLPRDIANTALGKIQELREE